MTHKEAVECVRKLINSVGTANVLSQSQKLFGSAGIPDIYCQVRRDRCPGLQGTGGFMWTRFWVEVKVGRDNLNSAQTAFIEREEACGGIVIVARDEGSRGPANTIREWLGIEEG